MRQFKLQDQNHSLLLVITVGRRIMPVRLLDELETILDRYFVEQALSLNVVAAAVAALTVFAVD